MSVDEICFEAEEKMEKAISILIDDFRQIRTGRANPGLVENIKVSYHGALTPLKHLATISTPDAQLIIIKPFDPSIVSEIEKALLQSEIGINPNSDGKMIRLVVPPLNEERRKKIAAQLKTMSEDTKVAFRNIRRDANKHIDTEKKEASITEDEVEKSKEDILKLIHDYETKLKDLLGKKTVEVLNI